MAPEAYSTLRFWCHMRARYLEREDSCIAGTKIGGIKAARKNLQRDPNFYRTIGKKGGSAKVPKGFALNRELARLAGKKGGLIKGKRNAAK